MTDNLSIFDSEYIIDGKRCGITPGQMLRECILYPHYIPDDTRAKGSIMDETVDRVPTSFIYDAEDVMKYKALTVMNISTDRNFSMQYPEAFTRQRIAHTLIEAIWKKGHFRLDNIVLDAEWTWNSSPLGNMAAFYSSVRSASEYIYDLGVTLGGYSCQMKDGACKVAFGIRGMVADDEEDNIEPYITSERTCPDTLTSDKNSWLIYIPFDSCSFRLGGSLLAEVSGHNGGTGPEIMDPDYFIDCYEVIRELVEDGVIVSGMTVGDGGLLTAAEKLCKGTGISLNISGIESAYQEKDIVRILFSEIPGVLIQIDDNDYDYIDAQMILQDIAYYPLGHPCVSTKGADVLHGGKSGVAGILAALLQDQSSEGED